MTLCNFGCGLYTQHFSREGCIRDLKKQVTMLERNSPKRGPRAVYRESIVVETSDGKSRRLLIAEARGWCVDCKEPIEPGDTYTKSPGALCWKCRPGVPEKRRVVNEHGMLI